MVKRKRAKSNASSDSVSSYKQGDSDSEEVVKTPRKRLQTRASTSKDIQSSDIAPASDSRGSAESPGKLLTAIRNLDKQDQPPSTPKARATEPTTPKSSPRKRAKTTSPKKKVPNAKPETEWRASDIPANIRITKGYAQKLFRLTAADLNDSDLTFREQSRGTLSGSMHLYNMRAVERLAWKKYGSPEGFDTVLENAKALWISKGQDPRVFPQVPRPYRHSRQGKCKQCNMIFWMDSNIVFDKCEPCRGIIRKPITRTEYDFDIDDYAAMHHGDPGPVGDDEFCWCDDFTVCTMHQGRGS